MECTFCKIIKREISADVIYEDEKFIVFKDIKPKAPVHWLIIPKEHIPSVEDLKISDKELISDLMLLAKKIAKEKGISEKGYKLIFNVGEGGGQTISHLHLHLLAGWRSKKERDVPGMP